MRTWMLLISLIAAGCLRVDVPNGVLKCSNNPKRLCPEGYYCAADDTCWRGDALGPLGPVTKKLGQSCGSATECASGYCADAQCCDADCTGPCQACVAGHCTNLVGAPHPSRTCPAHGSDTCAAVCTGTSPDCIYPGPAKACLPQACAAGTLQAATFCDGFGHCAPSDGGPISRPCPTPTNATAACAGDQCDFTCNPPYVRAGASCVAPDMM